MRRVADTAVELYSFAAEHARSNGVILADTKFEFGLDAGGTLVVGDEVLTPDSSRYWPADGYEPGRGQPSFDKQYVRDWATASGWDRKPPAPAIPDEVVAGTRPRYIEAYERITGEPFGAWLAAAVPREGPRADPAEGRDPRPPGRRRRAGPSGARLRWCRERPHRPADRARPGGPRPAAGRCARSCSRTRWWRTTRSSSLDVRRATPRCGSAYCSFPAPVTSATRWQPPAASGTRT